MDVVDKGLADWSNEWGGGREWGGRTGNKVIIVMAALCAPSLANLDSE